MADTPVLLHAFLGILRSVHRSTDLLVGSNRSWFGSWYARDHGDNPPIGRVVTIQVITRKNSSP